MTALPALALSLLTLTGACPLTCSPDGVPELAASPGEVGLEEPIGPPEADHVPARDALAADPLDLVDELTVTRLPGDETADLAASLGEQAEAASGSRQDTTASEAPSTAPSDPVAEHVAHSSQPPTASSATEHGDARAAWPQAQGEHVGPTGADLLVSLLVGLATIGLYHKLDKDRALEHRARRRILALLEDEPVMGTTDVADELDVAYRTARHHLEVLARFDLVVADKHRDRWRWARPENADALARAEVPALQEELLAELEAEPGLHLSELARRLDAAKATVKHHLDRLAEREAVRDEHIGPLRRFFPVEES